MSLRSVLAALAERAASALMRRRSRLPRRINAIIDDVAHNPDGRWSRMANALLGGSDPASIPPPSSAPDDPVRVYIGPTNYASQGFRWARALSSVDGIGARNMAIELPGGFRFAADRLVPVAVYNASRRWQEAEFAAVCRFSHVLIEAERPLFGTLFDRDVAREISELRDRGLSVAFLCHGTDIRSPRRHIDATPWSPYADDPTQVGMLQDVADANLALLERAGLPVFVSTPDLLADVPFAAWCPVVVNEDEWSAPRPAMVRDVPVVIHVPSKGTMKGTQLIDPIMRALRAEGVVDYRSLSGVEASAMPALIGDADIVLDQFRLGAYGVAACEAMAAGRVVVGHVLPEVRRSVAEATGWQLPVREADPSTLEQVVRELVENRAAAMTSAALGPEFVAAVHSGPASSAALISGWLERGVG